MAREKDELLDTHYRRDFLTYDNHILDGEIFLQVRGRGCAKRNRKEKDNNPLPV